MKAAVETVAAAQALVKAAVVTVTEEKEVAVMEVVEREEVALEAEWVVVETVLED